MNETWYEFMDRAKKNGLSPTRQAEVDRSETVSFGIDMGAPEGDRCVIRDDVKCQCVGQSGPNPDCGACGGDGTVTRSIDLDEEAWKSIKQAASESSWIPPEYCMNDWVADVCRYLRDGK